MVILLDNENLYLKSGLRLESKVNSFTLKFCAWPPNIILKKDIDRGEIWNCEKIRECTWSTCHTCHTVYTVLITYFE